MCRIIIFLLFAYYKVIHDAYTSLESSMDILKLTIDAYWNYIYNR